MAKTESPSCVVPGCKLPAIGTTGRCVEHKPPVLTVRQKIVNGLKFAEEIPDRDGARCVCGDGTSPRDAFTGLCRGCWRIWRWSPIAEHK